MTAETCGLTSCTSSLALESSALTLSNQLSRMPEAQYSLVPKLSHHEWQNLGFSSLKNMISKNAGNYIWQNNLHGAQLFLVSVANDVFPLMMFSVAKQRVMMSGPVQELALKHRVMSSARKQRLSERSRSSLQLPSTSCFNRRSKLEEPNISRGVFEVFVNSRNLN